MANKLKINRPCAADLASLSVYPNPYFNQSDRSNASNLRRNQGKFASSNYSNQRDNTIIQPNTVINRQAQTLHPYSSGRSQSQQSLSQGFNTTFSQPFSQVSQDEPSSSLFEDWRSNRSTFAAIPPPNSAAQCSHREENISSTKLALSVPRATNLIQKLNSNSLPEITDSFLSKEAEKRLETLSQDLSKVIAVLDSLDSDLQKISRDVCNASMETEGIKEKMTLQESSIRLLVLLKEEENFRETVGTALKELSEKDVYTASFQKLSDKLETLPNTFTQYLSMIKSELYACIHNEFQTVRECIRSTQMESWSMMNRINPYSFLDGAEVVASQKSKSPVSGQRKDSLNPVYHSSKTVIESPKPLKDATTVVRGTSKPVKDSSALGSIDASKTVKLDTFEIAKLDSSKPEKGSLKKPKRQCKRPARSQIMEGQIKVVASEKRRRPSMRLKKGTVSECPVNLGSSNLSPILDEEKGWISKRPSPPLEYQVSKTKTSTKVKNTKRKSVSLLTFEMEEEEQVELLVKPEISTQTRDCVDDIHDDEIQVKIRQQMIKARRKRLLSSSVSCSD